MVRSTEIESGVRTKRSMAAVSPRWTMMKAPRSTEGWPDRSGEIARIGAIARIADLGKADVFTTGMDGEAGRHYEDGAKPTPQPSSPPRNRQGTLSDLSL